MTTEDNPYFTNRESNEISQPNFLKSACLVGGTKCVTHLLVASLACSVCSYQRVTNFCKLEPKVFRQAPKRQHMRHLGIKSLA